MLYSDLPGASYLISPTDVQIGRVTLEHLHMLDYDGEVCNSDENYDYYQCKHDHLFKVSSFYRLSIERTLWHFNSTFGSSHSASSVYLKN